MTAEQIWIYKIKILKSGIVFRSSKRLQGKSKPPEYFPISIEQARKEYGIK